MVFCHFERVYRVDFTVIRTRGSASRRRTEHGDSQMAAALILNHQDQYSLKVTCVRGSDHMWMTGPVVNSSTICAQCLQYKVMHCFCLFFVLNLENISPFCAATDTPFWASDDSLPGFQSQGGSPHFAWFIANMHGKPQIQLRCGTSWQLACQLSGCLLYRHWWKSSLGYNSFVVHTESVYSGGSKGVRGMSPGSKFFQFHAVLGKFWQNHILVPPPRGNPGFATGIQFN